MSGAIVLLSVILLLNVILLLINTYRVSELYKFSRKSTSLIDLSEFDALDPVTKEMYRDTFVKRIIPKLHKVFGEYISERSIGLYYSKHKNTPELNVMLNILSRIVQKYIHTEISSLLPPFFDNAFYNVLHDKKTTYVNELLKTSFPDSM